MIRTIVSSLVLTLSIYITSVFAAITFDNVTVPEITDLHEDVQTMLQHKRPMIVEVSAEDCPYCRLIEESVLYPMILSGEYEETVLLRKIDINGYTDIKNFSGESITHSQFAEQYGVSLTPTVLFLDAYGNEIAPRMLGVPNIDFYGAYVDINIEAARKALNSKD